MKIDLSKLLKGLEALPHTPAPKPKKVSPYVLTHILEPLKTDDYVSFADLDFGALPKKTSTICAMRYLRRKTGNTG